jgi:hypothetical protein
MQVRVRGSRCSDERIGVGGKPWLVQEAADDMQDAVGHARNIGFDETSSVQEQFLHSTNHKLVRRGSQNQSTKYKLDLKLIYLPYTRHVDKVISKYGVRTTEITGIFRSRFSEGRME